MRNYLLPAKDSLKKSFLKDKKTSLSSLLYLFLAVTAIGLLILSLNMNVLSGILCVAFILYFICLNKQAKAEGAGSRKYLILAFLLSLFVFISRKIIVYKISPAYIPVSAFVMLSAVLFNDLQLSFALSVLVSCLAAVIAGDSLPAGLIFLITAIITAVLSRSLRRRMQLLTTGLLSGSAQMVVSWLAFPQAGLESTLANLFNGLICAVAVTGILPLLENVFGLATNISLLELSDFNHPLLKRMILDAPGTYHHSLIVGNLAEAAAASIGANPLLARIGAYYHDIGKLSNPEYFMENQKADSKHSALSPSMSKMVIINHIKEGVELARKYRLKPAIVDFITQHHGSGLVYYFYRRALEEIEEDGKIQEEGFRYPGPKPSSKETAIVLLADSVEAASRTISEPHPARIEEVVHKVINNKFIDGQLDHCELTLRDLERIAGVFIHMLSGIYHGRIKYPETRAREAHHKKSERQ